MLKMILKDLRLSPLRSILTSVSMLVGIIAMLGSVLVGTLGREYLISVNAQVYGWSPTYSFVITESDFHDRNKMEQLFQRFEAIDDVAAVTFSMGEDIRFAPMKDLTPIPPNDVYQNLMAFDLVCTTEAYSQVYNLPMTSGRWLEPSSEGGSLEVVINKEAKNYFNDSPYAAGNVKSTLSLTPFNIVGVVNDGRDFPTIYADSAAILNFAPAMWQVQNANVYWHPTTGLTIEQIHSALGDILTDTIGGYWESAGRSDIGDTYDSVLSILQLGLLVTSLLLLFVSVLGQINIGLSSLEQRTHELLIRRAIGASRTNIVALVLGSQLILSIFVCFAAILISLILVHCIGALLPVDSPVGTPSYPISVAVVAVAVSVLTALLGGLLPALKAAKPYRLLLCVMISLLVIMLAGCSTSSDSDTNTRGFTDFATIEEEYLTTIESLNWPEGFTPPDALEGEDTGASFQIGYGDTRASNLWEYSWMQEWLDTYNTDSERAAKALAELEKAFDMPYMGTDRCDDATRKYLRDNIDKAKLGDPSGFTECIQANYAD